MHKKISFTSKLTILVTENTSKVDFLLAFMFLENMVPGLEYEIVNIGDLHGEGMEKYVDENKPRNYIGFTDVHRGVIAHLAEIKMPYSHNIFTKHMTECKRYSDAELVGSMSLAFKNYICDYLKIDNASLFARKDLMISITTKLIDEFSYSICKHYTESATTPVDFLFEEMTVSILCKVIEEDGSDISVSWAKRYSDIFEEAATLSASKVRMLSE